jgi:hypothetical protein
MRAVIIGVVNKEMAAESQLPIENFKKSRIINFSYKWLASNEKKSW